MIKRFIAATFGAMLLFCTAVGALAASPAPIAAPSPISEQTWRYLDQQPAGINSILAYSLGGRETKESAKKQLDTLLASGTASTATGLSDGIIAIVKLGKNPFRYKKNNLLSTLYSYPNLSRDGLNDVSHALVAYQSAQSAQDAGEIPDAAPNSASALLDFIVSSQQRSGGFSPTPGRDPDVCATAKAVAALAAKKDLPYVAAALDKAFIWLSSVQNSDGSFSSKNQPNSAATALTLTALRMCGIAADDARFVKEDNRITDVLPRFQNVDGGYAQTMGGDSDVLATELAVIALYTNETGLSPFLAPAAYPGYVSPTEDSIQKYLKFFAGFIAMLAIIYGLLLLTAQIGKKWGGKPLRTIPNPYDPDPPAPDYDAADTHTMEINIPMNATLPDFDEIPEQAFPAKKDTSDSQL